MDLFLSWEKVFFSLQLVIGAIIDKVVVSRSFPDALLFFSLLLKNIPPPLWLLFIPLKSRHKSPAFCLIESHDHEGRVAIPEEKESPRRKSFDFLWDFVNEGATKIWLSKARAPYCIKEIKYLPSQMRRRHECRKLWFPSCVSKKHRDDGESIFVCFVYLGDWGPRRRPFCFLSPRCTQEDVLWVGQTFPALSFLANRDPALLHPWW